MMTTRIAPGVAANFLGQHSAERNQDAMAYVGNLNPQVLFPPSFCFFQFYYFCAMATIYEALSFWRWFMELEPNERDLAEVLDILELLFLCVT